MWIRVYVACVGIVATMKELYRIRENGDNPFIDGFSSSNLCPCHDDTRSCLGILKTTPSETFANLPQGSNIHAQ
ncbi:hypothetical protein RU639_006999 [Aspergillus parasiticus]